MEDTLIKAITVAAVAGGVYLLLKHARSHEIPSTAAGELPPQYPVFCENPNTIVTSNCAIPLAADVLPCRPGALTTQYSPATSSLGQRLARLFGATPQTSRVNTFRRAPANLAATCNAANTPYDVGGGPGICCRVPGGPCRVPLTPSRWQCQANPPVEWACNFCAVI